MKKTETGNKIGMFGMIRGLLILFSFASVGTLIYSLPIEIVLIGFSVVVVAIVVIRVPWWLYEKKNNAVLQKNTKSFIHPHPNKELNCNVHA